MIVIKALADTHQIGSTAIHELVRQRIHDLGGDTFDSSTLGYFVVVEVNDTIESIHTLLGFNILTNRSTSIRYDQPGFTPSFEFVEEFPYCYDMVFIISDDGCGLEIFVPKDGGINPDLLAMCKQYAVKQTDDYP